MYPATTGMAALASAFLSLPGVLDTAIAPASPARGRGPGMVGTSSTARLQ